VLRSTIVAGFLRSIVFPCDTTNLVDVVLAQNRRWIFHDIVTAVSHQRSTFSNLFVVFKCNHHKTEVQLLFFHSINQSNHGPLCFACCSVRLCQRLHVAEFCPPGALRLDLEIDRMPTMRAIDDSVFGFRR
jgi:hypothetical protein